MLSRTDVIVMSEPLATGNFPDQPAVFRLESMASLILVAAPWAGLIATELMASAISDWM